MRATARRSLTISVTPCGKCVSRAQPGDQRVLARPPRAAPRSRSRSSSASRAAAAQLRADDRLRVGRAAPRSSRCRPRTASCRAAASQPSAIASASTAIAATRIRSGIRRQAPGSAGAPSRRSTRWGTHSTLGGISTASPSSAKPLPRRQLGSRACLGRAHCASIAGTRPRVDHARSPLRTPATISARGNRSARAARPPARARCRSARGRARDRPPSARGCRRCAPPPVFSTKFACLREKRAPPTAQLGDARRREQLAGGLPRRVLERRAERADALRLGRVAALAHRGDRRA